MQSQPERPAVKPEQIREWRQLDVTKAFLADLESRVQEGKDTWAAQGYLQETAEKSAIANAKALGGVEILQTLIEFLKGEQE